MGHDAADGLWMCVELPTPQLPPPPTLPPMPPPPTLPPTLPASDELSDFSFLKAP